MTQAVLLLLARNRNAATLSQVGPHSQDDIDNICPHFQMVPSAIYPSEKMSHKAPLPLCSEGLEEVFSIVW